MIRKVAKVQTDNRELNQVQDNLGKAINSLIDLPLLNGVLLSSIALVSGDNVIDHKLGRVLIGWMIVRRRGGWVTIYDKQDTNTNLTDKTLVLNSSGSATVDLYVF